MKQNNPLRVLIVEDSEDDTLLLARELRDKGYDLKYDRVETAEAMKDALAKQKWDVIISDYSMPHFSGGAALDVLKQSGLDVPFIIVSGTIGEDIAVGAMKAGAQDYLLKNNLKRLIGAVEREMREAEVRQIKRELDSFAYIVSHDLKSPLRAISALADWLAADYGDKLDGRGREHLDLLKKNTRKMYNLIEGILQYSRAGRTEEAAADIDLNHVVKEAVGLLGPPENIRITVDGALPVLKTHKVRVEQVFLNLIGNAIKFVDKPEGEIHIGCSQESGFYKCYVSDNGPGIEERYRERIFQMFQTLGQKDASEDTGIGLAIVKKIIEILGGRVWVEPRPGGGSTFFFTLPTAAQ